MLSNNVALNSYELFVLERIKLFIYNMIVVVVKISNISNSDERYGWIWRETVSVYDVSVLSRDLVGFSLETPLILQDTQRPLLQIGLMCNWVKCANSAIRTKKNVTTSTGAITTNKETFVYSTFTFISLTNPYTVLYIFFYAFEERHNRFPF